jgi:ribosomal protein S18 acetylase RimI-like enzyme
MKRPSDQAKLLFFALLRSTATALATTGEKSSCTRLILPNIQLRLAKRTDVPSIHKCNVACLPENYNSHFYCSHLRQWGDLALVAEHVPFEQEGGEHHTNNFINHRLRPFSGFPGVNNIGQPEPKIVAYVLGKVDSRPIYDYTTGKEEYVQTIGHVTSLAVSKEYRRQGLAQELMKQLHFHLENYSDIEGNSVSVCGLHVRKSNAAASRLYLNDGYEIVRVIPSYYQDGEDAYFMTKGLQKEERVVNGERYKCWKHGPLGLRLPRRHAIPLPTDYQGTITEDSSSPELLTGTM